MVKLSGVEQPNGLPLYDLDGSGFAPQGSPRYGGRRPAGTLSLSYCNPYSDWVELKEPRISEIKSAAAKLRRAIEQSECSSDELFHFLETFPRVSCKPASLLLGKYLVEECDCQPIEFVSAQGWSRDGGISRSHFWLEYEGLIIDITADQYSEIDKPVIVTADRTWHNQFTHQTRTPYSEIMDPETLTPKVPATYEHILKALDSECV